MDAETKKNALRVKCPTCQKPPGGECVSGWLGWPRAEPHAARVKAGKKLAKVARAG